ncbi:MAG: glycosyltransferase family 39 protein [Chloroflexi bacterium]|nr:glycosyltransferase family 39 protein [Chloroflexota bacterium]
MEQPAVSSLPRARPGALTRIRSLALAAAPVLLLVLALGLRLYGINWDQGYLFHPDERAILMRTFDMRAPSASNLGVLLDADKSPWNPRWFPYGSFPLYLLKSVQLLLEPWHKFDLSGLRIPARGLSALADVFTVLGVYLLGRRIYCGRTALLAAALTTLAVLHIQLSHFAAFDTFLSLFVVLTFLPLMGVMQRGSLWASALAGVFLGLALASKVSAAPMFLPVGLAFLLYAFSPEGERLRLQWPAPARLKRAALGLGLMLAVCGIVLFITQPYAFLDWGRFFGDTKEQSEMVRRIRDYPYTQQYIGTPAYLYHIQQLALFGLGLPLGALAWVGLLFTIFLTLARGNKSDLLLLAWVVPYFALVGAFQVKFLRYMLPITPFLLLFTARMLLAGLDWARFHRRSMEPWAKGAIALALATSAFYALAYLSIYNRPHTAVRAANWITANVPPGAFILREHWEEGLPKLERYRVQEIPMYERDSDEKIRQVAQLVAQGDYLVFYSNRLYGTISHLPQRYPISGRYYRLLFSGQLGYDLVHFEASYPSLPGIALSDDTLTRPRLPAPGTLSSYKPAPVTLNLGYADESFSVYDHPKVLVFQKVRPLPAERIRELLLAGAGEPTMQGNAMLTPSEWAAQRSGGTWSEIIHPQSLPARLPVLSWLVLLYLATLAVLPLALVLLRGLPDRGYLLAKPLGLLLTAYIPWLLASLKWLPFGRMSIFLGLAALLLLSLVLWLRNRRELGAWLRRRWPLVLVWEGVFLAAFLGFLMLRMANPDLWHPFRGGEKPMDLAYLSGVLRSTYMPPYDPWLAGGFINYYYFGQFMVATLIKATGIPPEIAYNLAVPLFFALAFCTAFSIVYNLAEGFRRAQTPAQPQATDTPRGYAPSGTPTFLGGVSLSPLLAGLAAGLFVVVLGNLGGAVQLLQGALRSVVQDVPFPPFDFWRSTRMMPPDPPGFEITEFPFFTFLFADLHAHLMAIPLTLLSVGLSLNALLLARSRAGWRIYLPALALLALALGALPATNIWDYPVYLGLALGAVIAAESLRGASPFEALLMRVLVLGGLLVALSILFFYPYHARLFTAYKGIVRSETQTAFPQYLAIHGLFLFLVISLLLYEARVALQRGKRRQGIAPDGAPPRRPSRLGTLSAIEAAEQLVGYPLPRTGALDGLRQALGDVRSSLKLPLPGTLAPLLGSAAVLAAVWLAVAVAGYTTVTFLLALLALAGILVLHRLRQRDAATPFTAFALLLAGAAFVIGITVDLVTLRGDIGRMNTVFKLYLQGWLLIAMAAAFALWRLTLGRARSSEETVPAAREEAARQAEPSLASSAMRSATAEVSALRSNPYDQPVTPAGPGPGQGSPGAGGAGPQAGGPQARWMRTAQGAEGGLPSAPWTGPDGAAGASAQTRRPASLLRRAWIAVAIILVLSAAVYPLLGTRARLQDRFLLLPRTLNGMAYMQQATYGDDRGIVELRWDYDAIQWLRGNVKGSPVIVEGLTPLYRWGSRVSIYTGLPAVVGWGWHQTQQRCGLGNCQFVDQRLRDVDSLYTTPDPALAMSLLRKYQVEYVYVGETEARYYPAAGLEKFARMAQAGQLQVVYENPKVHIYQVAAGGG